jgi:hypothetical protein
VTDETTVCRDGKESSLLVSRDSLSEWQEALSRMEAKTSGPAPFAALTWASSVAWDVMQEDFRNMGFSETQSHI